MDQPALPLTVFEQFLLCEDRPAYPWSCFARMHFSGPIDHEAFESALRMVIPRHPLLQSRVVIQGRHLLWQRQPDVLPEIRWLPGKTGQAFPPAPYQNLRNEVGLRLFVVEDGESCDVTAQFHHACCDGVGIQTLLSDLLVAYALAKGARTDRVRLPTLDADRLARRGSYGLTFWKLAAMLPRQAAGLPGAFQFFARSPSPLLPHQAAPNEDLPPRAYPATLTYTFAQSETTALNDAAGRLNVTVNDLLTRNLYLALSDWRVRHKAGDVDDWLRVMIPTNLRSARDRLQPATNMVGAIFLDRRGRDFGNPAKLLGGIATELRLTQKYGLGMIFLYALHVLGVIPNGLQSIARQNRCMVSAILSNLGRPLLRCPVPREGGRLVSGNLVLQRTDGAVPLPPYNCVSFTAMEYARRLSMTLHYDPRVLSVAQADDLLSTFVRHVQETASDKQ